MPTRRCVTTTVPGAIPGSGPGQDHGPPGTRPSRRSPPGTVISPCTCPALRPVRAVSGGTEGWQLQRAVGGDGDIDHAARFTATGLDHPSVFDFLQLGKNASGMSFSTVSLAGRDLSGGINLSRCDFRWSHLLHGLQPGRGQPAAGPVRRAAPSRACRSPGADCHGCGLLPLRLHLVRAGYEPAGTGPGQSDRRRGPGITGRASSLAGAVLAEANLTGADLSGAATDLTGANFTGQRGQLLHPGLPGQRGIGGFDLGDAADRIIAFDYATPGQARTTWSATGQGPALVRIVKKAATNRERALGVQPGPRASKASAGRTCASPPTGSSPTTTPAPATSTTWSATGPAGSHLYRARRSATPITRQRSRRSNPEADDGPVRHRRLHR